MQRILAIALLTWKAALRFRLFIVIAVLLVASVVLLPVLVKDDGTARGFTQILLTYTLSVIATLLGLSTLWLACGTLARDIEECQMQVVATKPIARWQIWLGKWLGIMSLNAALLAISGASVYGLLQWRATKLPEAEQHVLRNEVLVARGSAKEKSLDADIEAATDAELEARLKQNPDLSLDRKLLRQQIKEQVKAQFQLVPPGSYRRWEIDLGLARNYLRDKPLYIRTKFNSSQKSPSGTFLAMWQAGSPEHEDRIWRDQMSLAPDTFHEFEIPAGLLSDDGVLTVEFYNFNDNTALLFPLDDGLEVLYREGGFGLNFARGLGIIFCWMALMATLGLAAASFLSFPVAAFFSLAVLTIGLASGTLTHVVEEGTLGITNEETGQRTTSVLDFVAVPVFRVMLAGVNLVKGFSPVDALSTGRSITWGELARAFAQIVLVMGGIIGIFGVAVFNRRELATAQGTQ